MTSCTAPINISEKGKNSCNLKCAYSFDYNDSTTSITNSPDGYLSMTYDNPPSSFGSNAQVTYNSKPYNVSSIRFYHPSLHTYKYLNSSNVNADGEMIIIHNSTSENKKLLVCIPIVIKEEINPASQAFSIIMKNIPVKDSKSPISLKTINFNLNDFIPMDPFISYKGTTPFPGENCKTIYDYIVFSKGIGKAGYVAMNKSDFDKFAKQITSPTSPSLIQKRGDDVFINNEGPQYINTAFGSSSGGGKIMIKCNPTDSSGNSLIETPQEREEEQEEALAQIYQSSQFFENIFFQYILNFVLMIIVLLIGYFIISLATGNKSKLADQMGDGLKKFKDNITKT